ncbi:MAG TPA: hypothetical protein VGR74_07865 [Actinomycetota bacterium]|nr:hypothetical protein [Actinomycetota bacterium]
MATAVGGAGGGGAQGGATGSGGAGGGGAGGAVQGGTGGTGGKGGRGGGTGGGAQGGTGGGAGAAGSAMTCRPQHVDTQWSSVATLGNQVGEPVPILPVADTDVFMAELIHGVQRWRNGQVMLELPLSAADTTRDVWGTSATDVWTVGSRVWHRDSIGWTEVPTPVTVPGGPTPGLALNTVWGRAADDVYVGGNQGILLHWNGAAWTRLPDPLTTPPDRATIVTGVFASAASDVWIIGTVTGSGAPANLQHWDGESWTRYTRTAGAWVAGLTGTVPDQPPTAIWGSGAGDVWIVGGAQTGGVSHYDGVRWTDMPPPGLPTDAALFDITGACPHDVWVVGARVSGFDPVLLGDTFEGLVYHFDGAGWTASTTVPDDLLRGVALSPGSVWITGRHDLYGSPR